MKRTILTLFILLSALPLMAEWKGVDSSDNGEFYIDFDRIREKDGYVYYWTLTNLKEKNEDGTLSYVTYNQGNCNDFRFKVLSYISYLGQMGAGGTLESYNDAWGWNYAVPNSVGEINLNLACSYVKHSVAWLQVWKADDSLTFYVNMNTLKRDKDYLQYEILADFKKGLVTEDDVKILSIRDYYQGNCSSSSILYEGGTSYLKNMAKGEVFEEFETEESWIEVDINNKDDLDIDKIVFLVLCKLTDNKKVYQQ